MASLLKDSGWAAIQSANGTFETLKKQVALYRQIEGTEGWKDYQFRLSQIREATRSAIERGGLDNFGRRHDDEQRAALFLLDSLLSYYPTLVEQYEGILSNMRGDEALAGMPLYGDDRLNSLTSLG